MSFKLVVEAFCMPAISVFGVLGNIFSICILRHKDVKLKRDFIEVLCSLACFDIVFLICTFFLFSLPDWSTLYQEKVFPILVPFLYPATNTFMTASIYMTVAVAVNRYMDMRITGSNILIPRVESGIWQSIIVFVSAALFNLPRWFEFEYNYEMKEVNLTMVNGTMVLSNVSDIVVGTTELRRNEAYVRDYTLIANTVCVLLLPTLIMLISTFLIVRQMILPKSSIYTCNQERARKKRNRSITLMLIGIIVLFFVCHIGEVIISMYEMILFIDNGEKVEFPQLIRNLIVLNHLLIVMNSSLNFAIYCKDLVFRECAKKFYAKIFSEPSCIPISAGTHRTLQTNQQMQRPLRRVQISDDQDQCAPPMPTVVVQSGKTLVTQTCDESTSDPMKIDGNENHS